MAEMIWSGIIGELPKKFEKFLLYYEWLNRAVWWLEVRMSADNPHVFAILGHSDNNKA